MFGWFKNKHCKHLFVYEEMQERDKNGNVHWPCHKCNKVFIEPCGLDIIAHGDVIWEKNIEEFLNKKIK